MDLRYLYITVIFVCLCSGFVIATELISPDIKLIDSEFEVDDNKIKYKGEFGEIEIEPYLDEKTPYTDFIWEIDTKEVYDEKLDKNITEETKAFYPIPKTNTTFNEFHWLVNKLQTDKTCIQTNPYYQTCSYEELNFDTFESKNIIENKTIKEIYSVENEFGEKTILGYLISYYGLILDLDPVLNLVIDGASDLIFTNRTEGSTQGARLSAPVLFMDFNKAPETLDDTTYINYSDDYVQDNSVYNNYGDAGNLKDNGMWVNGNQSGGLEFDEVDDYVIFDKLDTSTYPDGWSAFAWVKYYDCSVSTCDIFGGHSLVVSKTSHRLGSYDGSWDFSTGTITEGVWTHVGLTCNNQTGVLNFYINGVNDTEEHGVDCDNSDSNKIKYIGTSVYNLYFFNGIIDEAHIWNRTINQTEVSDLYDNNNVMNSTGLVGQWHFDETSGTSAENSADASNNGTLTNYVTHNPTYNSSCTAFTGSGGCYEFDGEGDYVEVADSDDLDMIDAWTLSAWIKRDSIGSDHDIIEKYDWVVGKGGYIMRITGNKLGVYNVDGTTTESCGTTTTTINAGQWYHVVGTFDSSTDTLTCYVNGTAEATNTGATKNPTAGLQSLKIGTQGDGSSLGFFNGSIDQVQIWDRALSSDEISALYSDSSFIGKYSKSGDFKSLVFYNDTSVYWNTTLNFANSSGQGIDLTDANLVSYWKLDENYLDSKGSNHGTATNHPKNSTGLSSDAMLFDGVEDYVEVPNNNDFNININEDKTISCWLKAPSGNTGNQGVIHIPNILQYMRFHGSDIIATYLTDDNGNIFLLSSNSDVRDNAWHHIVLVIDFDGDGIFYVDGIETNDKTFNFDTSSTFIGNFQIGYSYSDRYFNGSIDEVLIYNDTLTNTEVMDLYKTGLSQHADTNISLKTRTATSYNLTDTGLVSQWSFNADYTDDKGANDGTNSGTERNEGNGTVGQGAYFDGADSITISNMDLETSQCWWNNSGSGWSHYCNSSGWGYINGVQTNFTFNLLSVSGSDLLIGNGYTGSIDEVRIYNRSLSASEITDLYNLGENYILWNSWSDEGVMQDGVANMTNTFGNFFQFQSLFDSDDTEVSAYLLNHSVGLGLIADDVDPYFTSIPSDETITYGDDWAGVYFEADDDDSGVSGFTVNDSEFTINSTGFLDDNNPITAGVHPILVTVSDANGNTNTTIYNLTVNKATTSLTLISSAGWTLTSAGYSTITGGNCPAQLTCTLWEVGMAVANPYTKLFSAGIYPFVYNTSGNINYTSDTISNTLTSQINASVIVSNETRYCKGNSFAYNYLDNERMVPC